MPKARKRAVEEEQAAESPQGSTEPVQPAEGSQQPDAEPHTEPGQAPAGRHSMATVALTGEPAVRLRALAAAHHLSLVKLVVRMMEVFAAQDQ